MLLILGLTLGSLVLVAAVHHEFRTACYGVSLSNGAEVLVKSAMYEEIVHRYRTLDELDDWARWDQAVLDTLRTERPNEWKLLMRSLGYQLTGELHSTKRQRQAVRR
jgi:hypothetical protein